MCVRASIKAYIYIYIYIYIQKLVPPNVQDMVTALNPMQFPQQTLVSQEAENLRGPDALAKCGEYFDTFTKNIYSDSINIDLIRLMTLLSIIS